VARQFVRGARSSVCQCFIVLYGCCAVYAAVNEVEDFGRSATRWNRLSQSKSAVGGGRILDLRLDGVKCDVG